METLQTKNCVLDPETIARKMRRMALEVAERNSEELQLILLGIAGNGEIVARILAEQLQSIAQFDITIATIQLNKKEPDHVSLSVNIDLRDRVVLLIDDVSNTGRTMMYAFKPLLQTAPKAIQTLVLVERSHKQFPVQTDYAGLSISTTLLEHITVETDNGRISGAYLF